MKNIFLWVCLIFITRLDAQPVGQKLQKAFQVFESDSQLGHALISLYVINAKTSEVIFERNSRVGLAPASTQKIITAATAFEILGKNFRYKTDWGYDGYIKDGSLHGNLYLVGSGDPTLGSWRYPTTVDTLLLEKWLKAVRDSKIKKIEGRIIATGRNFETQTIPDGWIWQDIGNYYGAGVSALNWHENQYDMSLRAGNNEGDPVEIIGTRPKLEYNYLINELKTGPKGSGDNGYIYFPPFGINGYMRGTIPLGENSFVISGSIPDPPQYLVKLLRDKIREAGINISEEEPKSSMEFLAGQTKITGPGKILDHHYSPSLDSIIYWLLKRSINFYGESILKSLAYEKKGFGATDSGIVILKDFWKQKELDPGELNIKDGSGLSPQNRVTTHVQVEILKYAKKQSWFPYFFDALPEFNNMKMKSGSISDVKGFCGYHTAGDGTQYIFSFIVNNYSGSSSSLVLKMYRVLDVLK